MNKIFFLIYILCTLSSCSFQSSQYDFVKKVMGKENITVRPKKNWTLEWMQKETDLYAVNANNKVIFADNLINIFFENMQIYKITGLFPNNLDLEIKRIDQGLEYFLDGKIVTSDFCELAKLNSANNSNASYSRVCYEEITKEKYENQVNVNSDGLLISMAFKVHPSYPLLQLSIK